MPKIFTSRLIGVMLAVFSFANVLSKTPLTFIGNRNQWPAPVLYKADIPAGSVFFTGNGFRYNYFASGDIDRIRDLIKEHHPVSEEPVHCYAYDVRFAGSNPDVKVEGGEQLTAYHNYFLGNDPAKWASNVPLYGEIVYESLYKGIDLKVYSREGSMKYDFLVAPGADASLVRLQFTGVRPMISEDGDLIIQTTINRVKEEKPFAYQVIGNATIPVACRYRLKDNVVSFEFPNGYDLRYPLVIDPALVFATYSGSAAQVYAWSATYDNAGNLYAGGQCTNLGWPVSLGAYQVAFGGADDAAISKYSANGNSLIYATYYGGSGYDIPNAMVVNSNEELVICGFTYSPDLPVTTGCYDDTYNGTQDIYVVRFNNTGSGILGATFVGGSSVDGEERQEVLISGSNIIVGSTTASANFPVTNGAYQTSFGGVQDGVLFSLDGTCSNLLWSTFLGGEGTDKCNDIVVAGTGNIVACGRTASTTYPVTPGCITSALQGGEDAFVSVFNNTGNTLVSSTYIGTSSDDNACQVLTDTSDNIYLYGISFGNFPVSPGTYSNPGGKIFVQKLSPSLNAVLISTVLGSGSPWFVPTAFNLDICGNIYACGFHTLSGGYPVTSNAFRSAQGGFWFCVLGQNMSTLEYATYFANMGDHHLGGTSRIDDKGILYHSVNTSSTAFPVTPNAYSQVKLTSGFDMASFKFNFQAVGVSADIGFTANDTGCVPYTVQFTNNSVGAVSYIWDFGDGSPLVYDSVVPPHTYTNAGSYTVKLYAHGDGLNGCIHDDTAFLVITVIDTQVVAAAALAVNDTGCAPYNVIFINNSTGALTYDWDFGDGSPVSNAITPAHTYTNPGNYTVKLYAHNPSLCKTDDTAELVVQVLDSLSRAVIQLQSNDSGCAPYTLILGNNSTTATHYLWDFGDGSISTAMNPGSHLYSQPGVYNIKLIAINNGPLACTPSSDTDQVMISVFRIDKPVIDIRDTLLCNEEIIQLTVNVTNLVNTMRFEWTPVSDILSDPAQQSVSVAATKTPKDITVTVINELPGICERTTSATIKVSAFDRPTAGGDTLICPSDTAHLYVEGTLDSIQWVPDYYLDNDTGKAVAAWPPASITYAVYSHLGRCSDTQEVTVSIAPAAVIHIADSTRIFPGESYQMSPEGNCIYFSWFPPYGLTATDIANPVASPGVNTRYFIDGITQYGCKGRDSIDVYVNYDSYVDVPNAFTPDFYANTVLYVVRKGTATLGSFRIFNRWGNKIFETSDIDRGWDGTFNGVPQPPGVYVYVVEAFTPAGRKFYKQGNVTLIR